MPSPLTSTPARGPVNTAGPRGAFTLVELLVVIGIIALLISILLPALNRAREKGNQVKCLSNMRQLGMAMLMYVDANKGSFPASGLNSGRSEDWIYWKDAGTTGTWQLQNSAIAPYAGGLKSDELLTCPSDALSLPRPNGSNSYRFSYSFNRCLTPFAEVGTAYPKGPKIGKIKRSAEKVMLVDEDERSVNDGRWEPHLGNYAAIVGTGAGHDYLAVRHDRTRKEPDTLRLLTRRNQPFSDPDGLPNYDRRGNAVFLDGHAEYVERQYVHNYRYFDPYAE